MNQQLTRFDITALNRALIGFDQIFNDVERRYANSAQPNYPPYNILKTSEHEYTIEVAVTGFAKDEVEVHVDEGQLVIKAESNRDEYAATEYLHRGLAARNFERRFTLADHMEVGEATVADGLLKVYITRVVPEALKPRQIAIK